MARSSVALEQDQLDNLREIFDSIDEDGSGFLELDELHSALEAVNMKLPNYQIRDLVAQLNVDEDKNGKLDMNEFKKLYAKLKSEKDLGIRFKKQVTTRKDVQTHGGSSEGITHTVKDSERLAFANWINSKLSDDEDCKNYLPVDPDSDDLYRKCKDGILLCKLINDSVPGTIDERTINKNTDNKKLNIYHCTENHNLALNSAIAIGCNVVNIGHVDLTEGKPHLVLGLLWQIIRIGLLSEINLTKHPGLVLLLEEGETIDDLLKLSPEEILIRWVNYHLRNSQSQLQIANFSGDIKDSEAYTYLLNQIAPRDKGVQLSPMDESDMTQRAEYMLQESEKIDCRAFITPQDVVKGNSKLNLAFVANLFNQYPALEKPDDVEIDFIEETREEKTYRNWMNSMGVRPFVNRLYSDLTDGQILFQLYDIIRAGIVDWNKVIQKFHKMKITFEKIENCNYAVQLGKDLKFSLVGISGQDIHEGKPTLTLGLVWQLMRAYTLSMLKKVSEDGKPVDDKLIVGWANNKLKECGKKSQVGSFQDQSLSDAVAILELIDCIAPKKVNWTSVKTEGSDEDKLSNAKYAISMGRKIGARIYALPEDIVEVKPKMVMTIFACLMTCDKDLAKAQSVE